jgi:hypothetical protein
VRVSAPGQGGTEEALVHEKENRSIVHHREHHTMRRNLLFSAAIALGALALFWGGAFAQDDVVMDEAMDADAGLPVACDVSVEDVPDDGGGQLHVTWGVLAERIKSDAIMGFEILRYRAGESPETVGDVSPTDTQFTDTAAQDGTPYQYIVRTKTPFGSTDSAPCEPGIARPQWFARGRLAILVMTILFCGSVLYYLTKARAGREFFIRKIPGLEAVDDAVGRATEMGRPVLYVPGIEVVSEVGTLAALTILGHVAKKVAMHGTPLDVPCADPIVMSTAQEIVKAAYAEVGRPDDYDPNRVTYLTYDQFGYTAGVDGMMMRDRPEAVFLLGTFYAESLIMAETGHAIGAIQIAGTKETSQLPFFVAACDYTLIGEELFAASSYLSREPVMLGSLKGQDLAKLVIVYFILTLFVVGTVGALVRPDGSSALTTVFDFVKSWLN